MLSSTITAETRGKDIEAIAGSPPDMRTLASGCSFAPGCRFAIAACTTTQPAPVSVGRRTIGALHLSGRQPAKLTRSQLRPRIIRFGSCRAADRIDQLARGRGRVLRCVRLRTVAARKFSHFLTHNE
jgi:hypothetical protein